MWWETPSPRTLTYSRMRYAAFLLLTLVGACDLFTGPKHQNCRWRYTRYETRTDTVWNTAGAGYILVTHEVPVDSARECRLRDGG